MSGRRTEERELVGPTKLYSRGRPLTSKLLKSCILFLLLLDDQLDWRSSNTSTRRFGDWYLESHARGTKIGA